MSETGSIQKKNAAAVTSVTDDASISRDAVDDSIPFADASGSAQPRELGGPAGPDPTRYGDWERNGRCIDF